MIRARFILASIVAALAALLLASGAAMADVGEVGVDADPAGNEAGSLGTIDNCIAVAVGDTVDVDIYVKDVDELIALSVWVRYDPAVLEVSDRDTEQFLTTAEDTGVLDGSDATPDSDGSYQLQAVNASDTSVGATGSGVLARVTFTAVAAGTSDVDIRSDDLDDDGVVDRGVYLLDFEAEPIGDDNEDTLYDGTIRGAAVAVDGTCEGVEPPVSGEDDSGSVIWIALGAAAAVAVVLVLGGLVFLRRRRSALPN